MIEKWPEPDTSLIDEKSAAQFEKLKTLITAIRTFRAEHAIDPKQSLNVSLSSKEPLDDYSRELISPLARVTIVESLSAKPQIHEVGVDIAIEIPHDPTLDAKRAKERTELEKYIATLERKLSDKTFVEKAPAAVVAKERVKLEEAKLKLLKIS